MNLEISRLINFAVQKNLIDELDVVYASNLLVEVLGLDEFEEVEVNETLETATLILEKMLDFCVSKNYIEDNTTERDLLDTKIMNCLMPRPSEVVNTFNKKYQENKEDATSYYYNMSIASNYIRKDRTDKNIIWKAPTNYGDLDITINLSKPEKDPKEIAKAKLVKSSSYPKCLLCKENEGFMGNMNHPARQNHRIIPMEFAGENWFLQYSPYVYYNEHCILFNKKHTPMKIYKKTFENLLGFVDYIPHYFAGSNADLPIVGGSILSHDHYQGGNYTFAMEVAEIEEAFKVNGYDKTTVNRVKWPMSVIRLIGEDKEEIINLSEHILNTWKHYSDENVDIIHKTDEVHNTITPIARKNNGKYEVDLVLRNNRTNETHPMGIFHPHSEVHHIKKENIGLIEVMGLAVLPARLEKELDILATYMIDKKESIEDEALLNHNEWYVNTLKNYDVKTKEDAMKVLKEEVGKKFETVLEHAGVFKRDKNGINAFNKFITSL
ncbi:MAG: UDP-glucose--hexose-1-phosphate uridylyltransferase [Peptostreptococcaceae bacterium]